MITWWRDRRWRRELRRAIAVAQENYRTGVWRDECSCVDPALVEAWPELWGDRAPSPPFPPKYVP